MLGIMRAMKKRAKRSSEEINKVVIVILLGPNRETVLLREKKYSPSSRYWKFPGGMVESSESNEAAAARELWEETGIVLGAEDFVLIGEESRAGHTAYYFTAKFSPEDLHIDQTDRVEVRSFNANRIEEIYDDMLPVHRSFLIRFTRGSDRAARVGA